MLAAEMSRAFSAAGFWFRKSWGVAPGWGERTPLAFISGTCGIKETLQRNWFPAETL